MRKSSGAKENQSRQLALCLEINSSTFLPSQKEIKYDQMQSPIVGSQNLSLKMMSWTWSYSGPRKSWCPLWSTATGCASFKLLTCLLIELVRLQRTAKLGFKLCASILCSLVMASVHVIRINTMERINWMSYSVSRDAIISSSNIELDCHGVYDRRSRDELWASVLEWVHVS